MAYVFDMRLGLYPQARRCGILKHVSKARCDEIRKAIQDYLDHIITDSILYYTLEMHNGKGVNFYDAVMSADHVVAALFKNGTQQCSFTRTHALSQQHSDTRMLA